MKKIILLFLVTIFANFTYSYIEESEIHAFVFERFEKHKVDDWWLIPYSTFPEERREM